MIDEMFGPQKEYKQSESKRRAVRERVQRHRQRTKQDPPGKLSQQWEANLVQLDDGTRATLLEQQDEAKWLTYEMSLVCAAVNKLRGTDSATPSLEGESTSDYLARWGFKTFPDELFKDVKEFMQRTGGTVRSWCPNKCSHYEGVLDTFDDEAFKTYGLRTKLWEMQFRQFVKALLSWADASTSDCDPQIHAEAKQLCVDWYPYP